MQIRKHTPVKQTGSQCRIKSLEKLSFSKEVSKLQKDYSNLNRYHEIKHFEQVKKSSSAPKLKPHTGNFLQPTKIISVSAEKWAIIDYYNQKYIRGYRAHTKHQLSVFSKLLVFCTVHTLIKKHNIDMDRFETIVTATIPALYPRTSVKQDDVISLEDLLHLMLMQENEEYELILAINMGAYLQKKRKQEYYSVYDANERYVNAHMKEFYEFVNSYCKMMKLENIKYVEHDPVLRKEKNSCSAMDVAMLSLECLKIPLFRDIMQKKIMTVNIKYINDSGVVETHQRNLTNKTIENRFISYFNVCRNWQEGQFLSSHGSVYYDDKLTRPIMVVVLGCYNVKDREKDIQQIIEWYLKQSQQKQKKIKTELPELVQEKLKINTFNNKSEKYDQYDRSRKEKTFARKSKRTITEL